MVARDATEILESLGANVARHRRRLRLTQSTLAESAGLADRMVQRVERAEVSCTVVTLVRLAEALGIPVSGLLRPARLEPPRPGRPRARSTSPRSGRVV